MANMQNMPQAKSEDLNYIDNKITAMKMVSVLRKR